MHARIWALLAVWNEEAAGGWICHHIAVAEFLPGIQVPGSYHNIEYFKKKLTNCTSPATWTMNKKVVVGTFVGESERLVFEPWMMPRSQSQYHSTLIEHV